MLSEPNAGGMSAAFLLMSAFFVAPPSAVWMTSIDVSLPKSKSFGGAMLYSSAEALAARDAIILTASAKVKIFFILYPPHPRFLFCASPAARRRRPRLPRPRSQWG